MEVKKFSTWKYAEEHAKRLIDKGQIIAITMAADVDHDEDGEIYTYDDYIVTDHGHRSEYLQLREECREE